MLIKEYRIPLPLTVEEYRIAQLYMIAKKSRDESHGEGSGVEILVNEPYTQGPGGAGQYTHKIFHVGSHLPGWLKGILPKSALMVEELAWNAYPYTRTRYTCPFVDKFSLDIETVYHEDGGHQDNVFNLKGAELSERAVDLIDVVKDLQVATTASDYVREEDPCVYVSRKTGRGPLIDTWINDYARECKGKKLPLPNGKAIMCAYKLCRVEFKYWGMQAKIERFIHDIALRKTMVRAHRQAWTWQDEWYGLTMDDIREIERQTQLALAKKYGGGNEGGGTDEADSTADGSNKEHTKGSSVAVVNKGGEEIVGSSHSTAGAAGAAAATAAGGVASSPVGPSGAATAWPISCIVSDQSSSDDDEFFDCQQPPPSSESSSFYSPSSGHRMAAGDGKTSGGGGGMVRWSSMELVSAEQQEMDEEANALEEEEERDSIFSAGYLQRYASANRHKEQQQQHRPPFYRGGFGRSSSLSAAATGGGVPSPPAKALILVFHGGTVLDSSPPHPQEAANANRAADVQTLRQSLENVARQHFAGLSGGRLAVRLVPCPSLCPDAFTVLNSLSPMAFVSGGGAGTGSEAVGGDDGSTMGGGGASGMPTAWPPLGCLPLFAASSPEYADAVTRTVLAANRVYSDFLKSPEGVGFIHNSSSSSAAYSQSQSSGSGGGVVGVVGDAIGSILLYDALCRLNIPSTTPSRQSNASSAAVDSLHQQQQQQSHRFGSDNSIAEAEEELTDDQTQDDAAITARNTTNQSVSRHPSSLRRSAGQQQQQYGGSGGGVGAHLKAPALRRHSSAEQQLQLTTGGGNSSVYSSSCSPTRQGGGGGAGINVMAPPGSPSLSPSLMSANADDRRQWPTFDFEVGDCFMLGSPLALVLAYRKWSRLDVIGGAGGESDCQQWRRPRCLYGVYNMFHLMDPLAARLEPLLSARFAHTRPISVPRYQRYPLGDGKSSNLVDFINANPQLFNNTEGGGGTSTPTPPGRLQQQQRRQSENNYNYTCDQMTGGGAETLLTQRWWGTKRLDYVFYCPEGLMAFPPSALPHLLHASFWESADVAAFILRNIVRLDGGLIGTATSSSSATSACAGIGGSASFLDHEDHQQQQQMQLPFSPSTPCEKWQRKRTSVKIKNIGANHRANDVIVNETMPQVIVARFTYGPLDMVSLTGEKVDVYCLRGEGIGGGGGCNGGVVVGDGCSAGAGAGGGDWELLCGDLVTDKTGRLVCTLPPERSLPVGLNPVKVVVRGDHTYADLYVAVLPSATSAIANSGSGGGNQRTQAVVFSIDGSFTASVSVTGRDPKVRAGAVDVVRHWQELGYVIIYVTGRPDMQQRRVVSWLAQHNFPHGLLSFADGLSTDPLRHKTDYLRGLVSDVGLEIRAAYGSAKDIGVYSSVGVKADSIYIIVAGSSKVSRKQQAQAQFITEGYASHLSMLAQMTQMGQCRPANSHVNPYLLVPLLKGGHAHGGGPAHGAPLLRRRSAKQKGASSSATASAACTTSSTSCFSSSSLATSSSAAATLVSGGGGQQHSVMASAISSMLLVSQQQQRHHHHQQSSSLAKYS